jgi:hypothetical protein
LLTLAADPKRLGAQIGITAILHTWGQTLSFHPHLHCVVTGGGLAPDGSRWIATRPNYFLPVKVIARLFRGKFLAALKETYQVRRLELPGSMAALADPKTFENWLDRLYRQNWVTYAKRPFADAQRVFRYLGRYSHRVAIANSRLISLEGGQVCFSLERLRRRAPGQADVAKRRRVSAAFSPARASLTLRPHSSLRPPGGTQRRYQAGPLPATARPAGQAATGSAHSEDLGRTRLRVDRTRPTILSALPCLVELAAAAAHAPNAYA